jgi:hypothetical protein
MKKYVEWIETRTPVIFGDGDSDYSPRPAIDISWYLCLLYLVSKKFYTSICSAISTLERRTRP